MYDELVKRLRICPDYNEGCVNCPHKHDLGCRTTTMHEAADAIEELNRRIDRAIELYNRNVEKSAMYEALAGISPEPPKEETCTKN